MESYTQVQKKKKDRGKKGFGSKSEMVPPNEAL